MNRMKNELLILLMGFLILTVSCRKQYEATEEDKSEYGWLLFENSSTRTDYDNSKKWFLSSINQDTTYMDGYNGLGWTFGKLTELDSSIYYFQEGLKFSPGLFDTTNIRYEIWAGLCFANNAKGLDSMSILWGDSLISGLNPTDGLSLNPWVFSHKNLNSNNIINSLDVLITLAASNFATGDFNKSLERSNQVLSGLKSSTTLNSNINTIAGRAELAVWIDSLQSVLSEQ